jgi:hypothetical protein
MSISNIIPLNKKLEEEYFNIFINHWQFLNDGWPDIEKKKYNRQKLKDIDFIEDVKEKLYKKLGIIPVYFFLIVLWEPMDYCAPYRNIEKGLMILYYFITDLSMNELNGYIPRSSFYDVYNQFFVGKFNKLNKIIDCCLENMFSNINIRLLSSLNNNPKYFEHITLYIDGHDTRGIEIKNLNKASFYSYKLKKSGFRTQVIIDVNDMILYVSESKPCKNFNDGTMFTNMNINNKLHQLDCLALDGGYSQFVQKVIDNSNILNIKNFVYPFRKPKNNKLNDNENKYNLIFGSFRSKIEDIFSDLGNTFERLNNKKPIRTDNIDIFNLQFKMCCLLSNIKRIEEKGLINAEDTHKNWMLNNFDFPFKNDFINNNNIISEKSIKLDNRINLDSHLLILQKQFLGLDINNTSMNINNNINQIINNISELENMDEIDDNVEMKNNDESVYEVEIIINHRGTGLNTEYLIKWKNYSNDYNTWAKIDKFDTTDCIDDYFNRL